MEVVIYVERGLDDAAFPHSQVACVGADEKDNRGCVYACPCNCPVQWLCLEGTTQRWYCIAGAAGCPPARYAGTSIRVGVEQALGIQLDLSACTSSVGDIVHICRMVGLYAFEENKFLLFSILHYCAFLVDAQIRCWDIDSSQLVGDINCVNSLG